MSVDRTEERESGADGDANADGRVRASESGVDPGGSPTRESVSSALDRVTDPELDRSIVELGYVDEIRIESGEAGARVAVEFTLPTAWCSPAFAWMMASDSRERVESLPGVERCEVRLREHMHEAEVNEGVNGARSFAEAFPDAEGGVDEVRATLDSKARVARQYDAVETLLDAGLAHEQVAALTRADLEPLSEDRTAVSVRGGAVVVVVRSAPLDRYLRKAATVGLYDDVDETHGVSSANRNAKRSGDGDARVFRTPEGDPIPPERAELVHRRARLARVNMDGQGGVCDALHDARRRELARGDD
jgi:metal-sulfur cluster biosynthetic enzyme